MPGVDECLALGTGRDRGLWRGLPRLGTRPGFRSPLPVPAHVGPGGVRRTPETTQRWVYPPVQSGDSAAGNGLNRSNALLKPYPKSSGDAAPQSTSPCPEFPSRGGDREVRLAKGNRIPGNIWGAGFAFSITSAGGGRVFPQRAVNILCACGNRTEATSELSPIRPPLPGLRLLADFLFQTSGPCYTSECIIQTPLP